MDPETTPYTPSWAPFGMSWLGSRDPADGGTAADLMPTRVSMAPIGRTSGLLGPDELEPTESATGGMAAAIAGAMQATSSPTTPRAPAAAPPPPPARSAPGRQYVPQPYLPPAGPRTRAAATRGPRPSTPPPPQAPPRVQPAAPASPTPAIGFDPLALAAIVTSFFAGPIGLFLAIMSLRRAARQRLNIVPSLVALAIAGIATFVGFGVFGSIVSSIFGS